MFLALLLTLLTFPQQQVDPTVAVILGSDTVVQSSTRENPWAHQRVVLMKESEARVEYDRLSRTANKSDRELKKLDALIKALSGVQGIREAALFPCPGNCRATKPNEQSFRSKGA